MIFSVKALEADYEQAKEVIVCASDEIEALELAKNEIETVNNFLYHPKKQLFRIEQIYDKDPKIIAVII